MLLVTGANGFLGRNIHIGAKSKCDLLDYPSTLEEFKRINPKIVLHLAGVLGGIQYNKDNPATLIQSNLQMALNLFKAAREVKASRVVTIGSTCAYPLDCKAPFKTKDYWAGYPEPTNGAYGIAKRVICEIGEAYKKQYGISHCHIVLCNLYGTGDNFTEDGHVIPSLIRKFCSNGPVEIWGDGSSKREFMYVEDAAVIVSELAVSNQEGIINVGSGNITTITEISEKIQKATGYCGKVIYNQDKPNGQKERLLDSAYKGNTSLENGILKTVAYYKSVELNLYS